MLKQFKRLKEVVRETISHSRSAQINTIAGSLAFTTILSIVPLLAAAFGALDALGYVDSFYEEIEPFLLENLSTGAGEAVSAHLNSFLENSHSSTIGFVGGVGLLISSVLYFNQCSRALDHILHFRSQPPQLRRYIKAIAVIVLGPVLLGTSIGITAMLAHQIKVIPFGSSLLSLLLNFAIFLMIYGILPHGKPPTKPLLFTSFLMGIIFEVTKWAYAIYAKHAISYSKVYGSFSAIPLFLMWIYVSWLVVLIGAAFMRALIVEQSVERI